MTVNFATKSDLAYDALRERILGGELEPGSVLNQAVLARAIGISTTPLREALRRLKVEGLVELDAHRDARVTDLTAQEATDLLEVRRSLDPLAARLAAERRTTAEIRTMRDALSHVSPLHGDVGVDDLLAHRRFHAAIYNASHNELLVTTLDGLWDRADRYRRLSLQTPTQDQSACAAAEHRALLERVVAGDADGAFAAMQQHVAGSLGARAAAGLTDQAARRTLDLR